MRQRLNSLPEPLRVDGVKLSADDAGHEIVEVADQLSILEFFSETFTHSLSLSLRAAMGPGHPEEIIIFEPVEPGSGAGTNLGDFAAVLDQAIVEGVTSALNVAASQIAEEQLALFGEGIPATLVLATQIEAILMGSGRGARRGCHRERDCHRQRALIPFTASMPFTLTNLA